MVLTVAFGIKFDDAGRGIWRIHTTVVLIMLTTKA